MYGHVLACETISTERCAGAPYFDNDTFAERVGLGLLQSDGQGTYDSVNYTVFKCKMDFGEKLSLSGRHNSPALKKPKNARLMADFNSNSS